MKHRNHRRDTALVILTFVGIALFGLPLSRRYPNRIVAGLLAVLGTISSYLVLEVDRTLVRGQP